MAFKQRIGLVSLLGFLIMMNAYNANCQEKQLKGGINFTAKQWQDVLAIAKQQHKLIFVDAYAAWCAPCKELKLHTFTDKTLAAYFNEHFINVSVDVEKGEGVDLAEAYAVDAYPTLLFISPDGKLFNKQEGFTDAKQLMELATHLNK